MAAINMPQRPKDQLTAIAQAIGIANSIYGIRTNLKQFERLQQQVDANELAQQQQQQLQEAGFGPVQQAQRQQEQVAQQQQFQQQQFQAQQQRQQQQQALAQQQQALRERQQGFAERQFEAQQAAPAAVAKVKPPTGEQFKAGAFATRADKADQIVKDLQRQGFSATGLGTAIQRSEFFPEALKSNEVKKLAQAQRNFINAILRRESGAAIAPSEFDSANRQYFPNAGDSEEVLLQKAENRQTAIAALKAESGPALQAIQQQLQQQAPQGILPQAIATPQQGQAGAVDQEIDNLLLQLLQGR